MKLNTAVTAAGSINQPLPKYRNSIKMASEVTLVFPHQLFRTHPAIKPGREILLTEEWLYFRQYPFHKQKLIFHRATMKEYERYLREAGYSVRYIEAAQKESDIRILITALAREGVTALHYCELTDDWLNKRVLKTARNNNIGLHSYTTPQFICTQEELKQYKAGSKRFFQTDFYLAQRKKRNILLTAAGKPEGGKWSFDAENRERYPENTVPPRVTFPLKNAAVNEATDYCTNHFPSAPGSLPGDSFYPVTFADAETFLEDFIQHRFRHFGIYEDALVAGENYLHHSILTPLLNAGLLTPAYITEKVLRVYHSSSAVPLNSVEGFIRQITGWREFIRYVYAYKGSVQRTTNFFGFTRNIPASFWDGTTGIFPVDNVIHKVLATGYSHHIERLMVLGNFMLLCEFNPDEVYRWFMTMYIDAFDWVMVPNVYGMSQFADGGIMATKPYISGSNYLMKMSDYPKGNWQKIWDALFWRFISKHRAFFLSNPRLGMMVRTFDKMSPEKQTDHLQTAENYLSTL